MEILLFKTKLQLLEVVAVHFEAVAIFQTNFCRCLSGQKIEIWLRTEKPNWVIFGNDLIVRLIYF